MRRDIVEDVYRVYIWDVVRAYGNQDLKKSLRVEIQADNGLSQQLDLTLTKTNFGGKRLWFLCPNCSRRVGALYLPSQALFFACRHCYGLRYEVQTRHRNGFYETVGRPLKRLKRLERKDNTHPRTGVRAGARSEDPCQQKA